MKKIFLALVALSALLALGRDAEAVRKRRGLAHGASYVYDFTNGVPSTVSCSRASGIVWPQLTLSTASQNTAGSTCVYENHTGAAGDGGIWTWPAWSNPISTPNAFGSGGWSIAGSGVVTDNAAVSPDGTSNAASLNKNQASTFFANELSVMQAMPIALSFWYKNDTTPTAPGMNYWDGTGSVDPSCKNISAPPPSSWTRGMYWIGSLQNTSTISVPLALAPAGLQCGPAFTNTATGIVDYWGLQLANLIDYPLGAGSIAAQKLQLNSGELGRIVIGGDIELDIFARTWIQELRTQPDGCLIGGTGTDGEFSLCYSASVNTASAATWTLKVAGSTVLTTQMGVPLYGGELRARISCRPSSNTSVLRISINGATMYAEIATGTCNGGVPLNPLTSLYLGSNNGSSGYWPVTISRLVSYARPQSYNRDEIVWLGDSISSWTPLGDAIGARLDNVVITAGARASFSDVGSSAAGTVGTMATGGIYTVAQARDLQTHPGVAAVVHPGALCEQIESDYTATPYYGSGFTHGIIIECGTNNLNPTGGNQSAATAVSNYQHLVNTAAAANPGVPIFCVQITPWHLIYTALTAFNDCIAGGGGGQCAAASAMPVTGCTYVITHANTVLDDGSGNCLHCTDAVHPDNVGRQLMTDGTGAGTFIGSLTSAGLLP